MTIPFIPTNLFPFATRPYDNVQPFTLRDSATMLNTIDGIRRWIEHDLIPHLDTEQSELVKSWAENIESINTAVVNALAMNNADVAAIVSEQEIKLADFTTTVNTAISVMNGQIAQASESATAAADSAIGAGLSAIAAEGSATTAGAASLAAASSAEDSEASAVSSALSAATAVPRTPFTGALVKDDPSAALANTTIIQAALDDPAYRQVYIPDGLFYINALNVPANKHLTGEFSRAYTTAPVGGSRLKATDPTMTGGIITLNNRSKLSNICILGTGHGTTPAHDGIHLLFNGSVVTDVSIGGARRGINGNYKSIRAFNVHIWGNISHGIKDLLDAIVSDAVINANLGDGVQMFTGSGSSQFIGCRIEWNNGHGYNLYQSSRVSITGGIIDRNGKSGAYLNATLNTNIVGNVFWRNGKLSEGVADMDCNVYDRANQDLIINGNTMKPGADDNGAGGYFSPVTSIRSDGGSTGLVEGNILLATVSSVSYQSGAVKGGITWVGNTRVAGERDTFIGTSYAGEARASNIADAGVASISINLPALLINEEGRIVHVDISARSSTSSTVSAATFPVMIARPLSNPAVVTIGTINNIVGTNFGTTGTMYTITANVSENGAVLEIQISNTSGSARSFGVRAH